MRTGCAFLVTGLILTSNVEVVGVTVALTAVKKNNAAIPHTNEIAAAPGDVIEAELLIFDWADDLPDGIRSYSARIEGERGVQSGTNGLVLPKGWDAPVSFVGQCASDWDCSSSLTFSCTDQGLCRGPNHNPALGCFIDQVRADYIFHELGLIWDVGTTGLNYTYFGVILKGGVLDPGHPVYAGTLILVVGDSACGTFRFSFERCLGGTTVGSPSAEEFIPTTIPLVIQLPECPVIPVATDPADCLIDARMPHLPSQPQSPAKAESLIFTFDETPAGLTPESFRTRVVLAGPTPPAVSSVQPIPPLALLIDLDRPILPEAWTCIEHRASGREACLACLPGDVNADGLVSALDVRDADEEPPPPAGAPDDLLEWIPRFQQQLPRCDIDRSGKCTPLDVLTAMNLLIGSGFTMWEGAELPSLCPSTTLTVREPRGCCCNVLNGSFTDDALESNCQAAHQRWAPNTPCCEAPCSAPTGACCELSTGDCTNNAFQVNCQGIEQEWSMNTSCTAAGCEAILGACCNLDSGACGNNVLEDACRQQSSAVWYPGQDCVEILCAPQ